jgi:hypothetical protein
MYLAPLPVEVESVLPVPVQAVMLPPLPVQVEPAPLPLPVLLQLEVEMLVLPCFASLITRDLSSVITAIIHERPSARQPGRARQTTCIEIGLTT